MQRSYTPRGFVLVEFTDRYKQPCSLQESSLVEPCIWLGTNGYDADGKSVRMHLTQEMVKALLPDLQYFVEHGRLPPPEES